MAITLNTLVYNQDAFVTPNKVRYTGPANTFSIVDTIDLARVAPKPTADSDGVARTSMKRVKTLTLANGTKKNAYLEVTVAVPVGAASADVDLLRDDLGDLIISATGQAVVNTFDITH